jgi:hypothetical protein
MDKICSKSQIQENQIDSKIYLEGLSSDEDQST